MSVARVSPLDRTNIIVDKVSDVTPATKLVLLVLARHADLDGCCYPSQKLIAQKSGLGLRTVVAAIADLVEKGHLVVIDRRAVKGGKLNVYRVQPLHHVQPPHPVQPPHHVQSKTRPRATTALGPSAAIAHKVDHREVDQEVDHSPRVPLSVTTKPGKPSKPVDPRHGEVVAAYCAAFERARGVTPTFGGFEARLVSQLIAKLKGDHGAALGVIATAFADAWWGQRVTIKQIVDQPDRFRGAKVATNERPQQTAVADGAEWINQ